MRSPTAERRRMMDLNTRTHLLEREAELEQIGDALRTAAAGSGRILVIEGAPGIGKSSLLDEAAELAEAERMTVREGLDLANRCGSVVETDRAMDELRATGARPRRPAVSGVDSLSAQERRVAAMATQGLSNREIAEALFLTRRTVEMHLTGAYRKLDVSGRQDLPAALAASS
jgi:DNA-binding CsgD family transcriptional regulator